MARFDWKRAIADGLGDRRHALIAALLIALGVIGKIALLRYANIETVFVASLLAGSLLGRWYTVLVPLGVLLVLQVLLWGSVYPGYALEAIAGITFFVVTGYLFVGVAGRKLKPRVVMRVRSLALLTSVSIPLTIAYDLWTDVGEWYFLARPLGVTFWTVLELQVPFTLYHILSSLVFVPLFGALFLQLNARLMDTPHPVSGADDRKVPQARGG